MSIAFDNLLADFETHSLCQRIRGVLDDRFDITSVNGARHRALGARADHVRPFTDWTRLPAENAERGIHINERTAATRWCGESMDYGLGVQVLLQQAKKHRDGLAKGI